MSAEQEDNNNSKFILTWGYYNPGFFWVDAVWFDGYIITVVAAFFVMSALTGGLKKTVIPEVNFNIAYSSSGVSSEDEFQTESSEASDQYGVGPEDTVNTAVTITNTGNTDSYVFVTIKQPLCQNPVFYEGTDATLEADGSAPLYILNPNAGWTQVDEEIKDGRLCTTFAYETILAPGETADPVLDSIVIPLFECQSRPFLLRNMT